MAVAERNRAIDLQTLADDYGKVPMEEWRVRYDELHTPLDFEETMREDYNGVGVDEVGMFHIHYHADCTDCTFAYAYDADVQTDLSIPPAEKGREGATL